MALNLGTLFFSIEAQTDRLITAQRKVETFARQVRRAFNQAAAGKLDQNIANGMLRQEKVIVSSLERIQRVVASTQKLNLTPQGTRELEVVLQRLGIAWDNLVKKMATKKPLDSVAFQREAQLMTNAINSAGLSITKLRNESSKPPGLQGWKSMGDVLRGVGAASLVVQGHWGGMSTRLFALTSLVREFGVRIAAVAGIMAGASAAFVTLGAGMLKAGMALQQIQMQFQTVTGSTAVAAHDINFVKTVAQQAGLEFVNLATSYAKFTAAASVSGLTLNQTEKVFRGISLAASKMQLGTEQVNLTFLALEQMLSKGTVMTEELRRQLGDQLPGAFAIAAKAMDVSQAKLQDMLKKGMIPAVEFVPKFVDTLQKMWGINPEAPIETLKASINRMHNEWTFFLQDLATRTNILKTAQELVDGISDAMKMLNANIQPVAGAVGALVGAMAGMAAAFALGSLIQWIASWTSAITLLTRGITIVRELTAAVIALDAATAASGIGKLIGLLARLALVIGGAVLGYQVLNKAFGENAASIDASITTAEQYIKQQQAMGFQIRSVTQDLIKNTEALAKNLQVQAMQARGTLTAAQAAGPGIQDFGAMAWHNITRDLNKEPTGITQQQAFEQRISKQQKHVQDLEREATRAGTVLFQLEHGISQLPDQVPNPVEPLEKADKANRGIDSIINKIKDLIQEARTAHDVLDIAFGAQLGQNIQRQIRQIDAYGEALKITNNLNPKQRAAAAQTLGVPNDINAINTAIAGYILQAKDAQAVTKDWLDMLSDLEKSARHVQAVSQQLTYLREQGTNMLDPQQLKYFDNLEKAQQRIRDMQANGPMGEQEVAKLAAQLGVAGANADETAIALAHFWTSAAQGDDAVKALQDYNAEMQKLFNQVSDTRTINQFLQSLGTNGGFAGGATADAIKQAVDRGRQVADFLQKQFNNGITDPAELQAQGDAMLKQLQYLDQAKQAQDRWTEAVGRTQNAIQSMASDGLDAIKDFITGAKNLGDALRDLAKSFLDTAFDNFVKAPAQGFLNNLFQQKGNQAAGGIDQDIVNNLIGAFENVGKSADGTALAFNNNLGQSIVALVTGQLTQQTTQQLATASLGQLTTSAYAASLALTNLAASGGGGGSGGGILGAIIKGIGAFAGASGGAGGADMFGATSFPDQVTNLFDPITSSIGYALGGNMLAGHMYSVNETGVKDGEYFIPKVNGYMSPRSGNGSGGAGIHIDASTTIDARGATTDAIADLKAEMRARDSRLRNELPYMIDARVIDSSGRLRYNR